MKVTEISPEQVSAVVAMATNVKKLLATWRPESEISNLVRWGAMITLLAVLAGGSVYAHVHLSGQEDDYTGGLAILDRLFDLFLATLLIGLAFGVGRAITGKIGLVFDNVAEEIGLSVVIGAGVVGLSLLALGLAGTLKPLPIIILFLLLVAICARRLGGLYQAVAKEYRSVATTRIKRFAALLVALFVVLLILRAATPPHSYDEAIYHLSVAKLFAAKGRVFPVYDNWAGNMPFLVQMIYAACLIFGSDIAAKLFSLGLTLTCAISLYGFCARFLNRRAGAVAMIGFFGAGMVVEVGTTSRIDVTLGCMLFLATHSMIVYLESKQTGWLLMSAALSGFALGTKYSAGVWLALLGAMFLYETLVTSREKLRIVIRQGFLYVLIAAAVASPWFIKNLVWFQNPVYPFMTGEIAEVADGSVRYFTADDERRLEAHFQTVRTQMPEAVATLEHELAQAASRREQRHPFRVWEYFIYPDKYGMGEPYHDPNNLFLITPLLLFLRKRRWTVWLAILSLGFYVAVVRTSWVARILLPVYPAMTVLAAYVISEAAERAKARVRIAALLPAIAILIALGPVALATVLQMRQGGDLSFITGSRSRREYMYGAFYYPAIDFINHNLPSNARVLMIGAQMCYDMRREYVADVNWDTTEWRRVLARNTSMDDVNVELKARGITHVLFSPSLFAFAAQIGREGLPEVSASIKTSGPDYAPQLRTLATFGFYQTRFLDQVYSDKLGYHLYQIR